MANADRIRAMSNWELAEFIYNVSNGAKKISTCIVMVTAHTRLESG